MATLLACVAIAAVVTLVQKPTYSSTASVFLAVESGGTAGELSQGATYAERQVKSFVTVATSAMVLEPVITNLQLDFTLAELAGKISVTAPAATSVIEIEAEDRDPVLAADLANGVAVSLQEAVGQLAPPSPDGAALVSATVIDTAQVSVRPTAPRPAVNLALGAVLGTLLAVGQAVLRSLADTRVRTAQEVESLTNAPVLASIGHLSTTAGRSADDEGGHWANAEAYRRLRTNVGFLGLGGERRSSFVVTSATAGEGKTETVINLARVLAQAGQSVLLIDADLRRPQVAARLHLDSQLGLSDVLSGRAALDDLTVRVGAGMLDVLPAGTIPPNPSELLGSVAMAQLLGAMERQYDVVLFDSPPLLPVTDAVVLSAQTGGAVLVARSGLVRRAHLSDAVHMMKTADVSLLGAVLNDAAIGASEAYVGYYSASH